MSNWPRCIKTVSRYKKNKFPKVHILPFQNQHQVKKTGDTSIPQVTLRFMACFRVFVLRSGPLTSSSSSGSVWALGPADYIAEASSVHVKDEDVENNQCAIKIWFLKHREHFKEQIQIIATEKWTNIQRYTPVVSPCDDQWLLSMSLVPPAGCVSATGS